MDGEPHEQSILVEHPPVEQLPPKDSHQVTFNLEFQLEIPPPKQEATVSTGKNKTKPPDVKYFVTYRPPNCDDTKTEMFTTKRPRWSTQHRITVDIPTLLDIFDTPMEFKIWKLSKTPQAVHQPKDTQKHPPSSARNLITPQRKRLNQLKNLEKREQLIESHKFQRRRSAKRLHHPEISRAKSPPKPHHYDSPERTILSSSGFDKDELGASVGPITVISHSNQEPDASSSALRTKTPPMPHHFEIPDKHSCLDNATEDDSKKPGSPQNPNHSRPGSRHNALSASVETKSAQQPRRDRSGRMSKTPDDWLQMGFMRMNLQTLFWDQTEVTCVSENQLEEVDSVKIRMWLNGSLLNEYQRERLNPMCITVLSADPMPNKPLGYTEQQKLFDPVYCKIRFFDGTSSCNQPMKHAQKLLWNSKHIFLTGVQDLNELKQKLLKYHLAVEVHDRDQDEAICIGETCPFGVASFCLTDFVLNSDLLSLKLNAPISAPTSRQYYEKLSKRISGSDWLSANTSLKILINISYPLYLDDAELSTITAKSLNTVISGDAYDGNSANNDDEAELQSELAYLSVRRRVCKSRVVRIVVVVESCHAEEIVAILRAIRKINSNAVKPDEKVCEDTDILTGCHVYDTDSHIFFIEGFQQHAITSFLASKVCKSKHLRILTPNTDLVNSGQFSYPERLWFERNGEIYHLRLKKSIRTTMGRGSVYTQKTTKNAFKALQAIFQICSGCNYEDIEKGQLFLHPLMIKGMVNGFASRANTSEVLAVLQKSLFRRRAIELDKSNATCEQSVVHQGNCNRLYEEFIKDARNRIPNFIQLNKVRYSDAKATQGPRERTKEQSVFIYSNQTMNTAEMYKKELYQGLLKKFPHNVFEVNGVTKSLID